MKHNICLIGCGWLGFPLAISLIKKGYLVNGTTTSSEKINVLNSNKINGFKIKLSSEGISGDVESCLVNCETLILNIPPGLRKNPKANYVKQMQHLLPYVESSSVKNVLFVSSTSVYDDDERCSVITESSQTSTTSKVALQLLAVESLFQNNSNFNCTILRFSGLFGDQRHPVKYLSGRNNIKNPNAPVNLIHQKDCINIIENILEQNAWNTIFNASAPSHPSKKNYYTSLCLTNKLPVPEFDNTQFSKGKIINSTKLVQVLNYEFKIKLNN